MLIILFATLVFSYSTPDKVSAHHTQHSVNWIQHITDPFGIPIPHTFAYINNVSYSWVAYNLIIVEEHFSLLGFDGPATVGTMNGVTSQVFVNGNLNKSYPNSSWNFASGWYPTYDYTRARGVYTNDYFQPISDNVHATNNHFISFTTGWNPGIIGDDNMFNW